MRLVGRGLKFLHPHVQLHNIIFWYDVSRFLLIHGDVFSLWCFPCLCFWNVFMQGGAAPGSVKCSDTKRLFCLSWQSFLHLLTLRRHSDDCRGLSA